MKLKTIKIIMYKLGNRDIITEHWLYFALSLKRIINIPSLFGQLNSSFVFWILQDQHHGMRTKLDIFI